MVPYVIFFCLPPDFQEHQLRPVELGTDSYSSFTDPQIVLFDQSQKEYHQTGWTTAAKLSVFGPLNTRNSFNFCSLRHSCSLFVHATVSLAAVLACYWVYIVWPFGVKQCSSQLTRLAVSKSASWQFYYPLDRQQTGDDVLMVTNRPIGKGDGFGLLLKPSTVIYRFSIVNLRKRDRSVDYGVYVFFGTGMRFACWLGLHCRVR